MSYLPSSGMRKSVTRGDDVHHRHSGQMYALPTRTSEYPVPLLRYFVGSIFASRLPICFCALCLRCFSIIKCCHALHCCLSSKRRFRNARWVGLRVCYTVLYCEDTLSTGEVLPVALAVIASIFSLAPVFVRPSPLPSPRNDVVGCRT